jgi:hypothetical protein
MRLPRPWMAAWAVAGFAVLVTSAAFATGFVSGSSTSTDPVHGEATPLFGEPSAEEFALYPANVTTFSLPIGFDVLTGQIAHDTDVFTVTIPANDPRTGSPYAGGAQFALNVYVTNQPDLVSGAGGHTPWTTLQLQWTLAPCPGGTFYNETATTPTFSSPTDQAVMAVTSGTIHVALTGMAPGSVYCAGVMQAYPDANDPSGTDIARPYATDADANAANAAWTSAIPVTPQLTAQIQRVA